MPIRPNKRDIHVEATNTKLFVKGVGGVGGGRRETQLKNSFKLELYSPIFGHLTMRAMWAPGKRWNGEPTCLQTWHAEK